MLIADNIDQNLGIISMTTFGTLGSLYKMPGRVSIGQILSNSSFVILLLFSKVLKYSFYFFSKLCSLATYFY